MRLLLLDDLWTAQLDSVVEGAGYAAVEDVETLQALVGEMRECLANVSESAFDVRFMLEEMTEGQIAEALDTIARLPTGTEALRSRFEEHLPDYDPRSAMIAACDYIRDTAYEEADILSDKLDAVARGERPPGDLRKPFRCAAMLMLVGASVAGTIGLGGAPVFVGLSVVSTTGMGIIGWIEANCPTLLPAIGRYRR